MGPKCQVSLHSMPNGKFAVGGSIWSPKCQVILHSMPNDKFAVGVAFGAQSVRLVFIACQMVNVL